MTHGSLFSGFGGFDLAAHWMGWKNVFHCEINPFPRSILSYYWPNATSYEDITRTDFTVWRGRVDVLTGGFPCQPYSVAGKRLGKEDERHLWPHMLRAIREIQPTWVVGENVRGIINWNGGMVFDEVQADLEAEGYEVIPFILPAAGVGAPHERYRVWFIAYSYKCAILRNTGEHERTSSEESVQEWDTFQHASQPSNAQSAFAYSRHTGLQGCKKFGSIEGIGQKRNKQLAGRVSSAWKNFPTQSPICGGDDGLPRKLDGITFSKWRNESLKGYGNAVVPQIPFQIFKSIEFTSHNL